MYNEHVYTVLVGLRILSTCTWRFPRNLSVSQERGSEGGGCLLTLPLSCSSPALERSALDVTRHARAASACGPASGRASRRAALAPPCTARTAARASTATTRLWRLWLPPAGPATATQFRPVARPSRTRCATLRTLCRVSLRAALLPSACGARDAACKNVRQVCSIKRSPPRMTPSPGLLRSPFPCARALGAARSAAPEGGIANPPGCPPSSRPCG